MNHQDHEDLDPIATQAIHDHLHAEATAYHKRLRTRAIWNLIAVCSACAGMVLAPHPFNLICAGLAIAFEAYWLGYQNGWDEGHNRGLSSIPRAFEAANEYFEANRSWRQDDNP
jgi:hypothetical protein